MGYQYQQNKITEEIDPISGLFFLSMHRKKGKKIINKDTELDYSTAYNIAIYNSSTNHTRYLFDDAKDDDVITHLLYETGVDDDESRLIFNRHSSRITNNEIDNRALSTKILVCQKVKSAHLVKIWCFDKKNDSKLLITEIDESSNWVYDVKNQKIITYKRLLKKVDFEAFDF